MSWNWRDFMGMSFAAMLLCANVGANFSGSSVQQLRGTAGDRQVPNDPRVGLAQLYGAPGTAAVAILSR